MKIVRKKRFRIVGMLLAFVTAFSLVACGSDQGGAPGMEVVGSESGASGNGGTNLDGAASGENPGTSGASEETQPELNSEALADLGTMGITLDGTRYAAQAYQSQEGEIFISTNALEKLFGKEATPQFEKNGLRYASLTRLSEQEKMASYEYDAVLNAVYLWSKTFDPWEDKRNDIRRIAHYELGTPSEETLTYKDFMPILDKVVEQVCSTRLAEWESLEDMQQARTSQKELTRYEAALMVLRLATFLGDDYADFNHDWGQYEDYEKMSAERDSIPEVNGVIANSCPYDWGGFPNNDYVYDWDSNDIAMRFMTGRVSLLNGSTLFDFDEKENSLHMDAPVSKEDALLAVARLLDSPESVNEPVLKASTDASIRQYDQSIITDELLNFTADMPDVSDENPPDWHGSIWEIYYGAWDSDLQKLDAEFRQWSEWGFDAVYLGITYLDLFSKDGKSAYENRFRDLDRVIATALKYRMHIQLVSEFLPGRLMYQPEPFVYVGEFDMYTNPSRQAEAELVWQTIAARYAKLPSSVLSFQPIWGATNPNLSSGLEQPPEYTPQDVAREAMKIIDTIRQESPERYIVLELTGNNEEDAILTEASGIEEIRGKYDNVMLICNFCEMPFVYANMTGTEGENIDDCTPSAFQADYPTYQYEVQHFISEDAPLIVDGDLYKGTAFELYLGFVSEDGILRVVADGQEIFRENLKAGNYTDTYHPFGMSNYTETDCSVSFALDQDCKELSVEVQDTYVNWHGMKIDIPEEYAVMKWYTPSSYEHYKETGEVNYDLVPYRKKKTQILVSPTDTENAHILTIHKEGEYSSDAVYWEASPKSIDEWGKTLHEFSPGLVNKYEGASFSGEYFSSIAYYDDFLNMCEKYGFSWFTGDFMFGSYVYVYKDQENMLDRIFAGSTNVEYRDGWLRKDMFDMFQNHLPVINLDIP